MNDLKEAIFTLSSAVLVLAKYIKNLQDQDCRHLATKQDLDRMECRIIMKVSELPAEVTALKNLVVKVSKEQQDRFDAAEARILALLEEIQNNDPELPQETVDGITEVKTLLTALDDTIIDTTPPTP